MNQSTDRGYGITGTIVLGTVATVVSLIVLCIFGPQIVSAGAGDGNWVWADMSNKHLVLTLLICASVFLTTPILNIVLAVTLEVYASDCIRVGQ